MLLGSKKNLILFVFAINLLSNLYPQVAYSQDLSSLNVHSLPDSEAKRLEFYQKLVRKVDGQDAITATIFYGFLEMIVDKNVKKLKRVRFEGAYDEGPDEKAKHRNWLLEPCTSTEHQRCGFKVSGLDNDYLEKDIELFGQKVKFKVRLRSVTKEPNLHSSINDPVVIQQGKLWEKELVQSLKNDSITLVLSHSRHGSGPDPFYPVISPRGEIRYVTYYQANKPGLKNITQDYAPLGKAQIFLLGACKSELYFRDIIEETMHRQGKKDDEFYFIGTRRDLRLVDFDVAVKEIISGISAGETPKEFSSKWKNPKGTGPDTCFHIGPNFRNF